MRIMSFLSKFMPTKKASGTKFEKYSSEVENLLKININMTKDILNNAYCYLFTINATKNIDYKQLAKAIVSINIRKVQQAIKNQDLNELDGIVNFRKLIGNADSLPLTIRDIHDIYTLNLTKQDDLERILEKKSQLILCVKKYDTLLARYDELIELSYYRTLPRGTIAAIPDYSILNDTINIKLAKAVICILDKQDITGGLEILQKELTFSKLILISDAGLTEQLLSIRRLFAIYHILGLLLDTSIIMDALDNPSLLSLFTHLTEQEQRAIAHGLMVERQLQSVWLSIVNEEYLLTALDFMFLNEDFELNYDKEATLNQFYKLFEPMLDEARITLPNASSYYQTLNMTKKTYYTNDEILAKYGVSNSIGGILIERLLLPKHQDYILRFYNLVSYLTLIRVKLRIKQEKIAKGDVMDFLVTLGDEAKNPYSQQPLHWSPITQELSTDWSSDSIPSHYGKKAVVYIKF